MPNFSRLIAVGAIFSLIITISSCSTPEQVLTRPDFNAFNDSLPEINPIGEETVNKLLEKHKINGASIAFINYDQKGWKRGYGYVDAEKTQEVTEETQFQAASISKVLSAYALMTLVENNRFKLDMDLRAGLAYLDIENAYPGTYLSLRNLLKHKAGINYYQLKGYNRKAQIPTIEDVLAGVPPAQNEKIKVVDEPYKTSKYSEGGYVLLEKLINERLKDRANPKPFQSLMEYGLFENLNMKNSSVGQPKDTNKIAFGYDRTGKMLDGKFYIYPENAAGGVWSTPQDLSLFLYEVASFRNYNNRLIKNKSLAEEFVTDGLGITYDSKKKIFGSFGRNEGYTSQFFFSLNNQYGLVIMCNSENGGPFMEDIYKLIEERFDRYKKTQQQEE